MADGALQGLVQAQAGSAAHSSPAPAPHIRTYAPLLGSTKAPGSTKKSTSAGRHHHHARTARTHCQDMAADAPRGTEWDGPLRSAVWATPR